MQTLTTAKVQIQGKNYPEVLSEEALDFLAFLHQKFNQKRLTLLKARELAAQKILLGDSLTFRADTKEIRDANWQVNPIPADLQDRRAEITGPVDRKMVINALNSGAKVFMADFEDATSPTWTNLMEGQQNLYNAVRRQVDFTNEKGKKYSLNDEVATLKVRPRGWHLEEKHMLIEGERLSGSLVDFGLFFFHNANELIERGSGPYFYLPKLESYEEAQLWNDVFVAAQDYLQIPQGSIKATVLIETIPAAFQMEEIIYALREHMAGLNAGRWDYIFSFIKKFRNRPEAVLPDRALVGMQAPFMAAYASLLVKTCHKRGAFAIGGMSAFIPAKDEEVNKKAFAKVEADKKLEANRGYDGTWVAHPFLVETAQKQIESKFTQGLTHQLNNLCTEVNASESDLVDTTISGAAITEQGLRTNINVGLLYIEHWLRGIGAAALYNLMEDAATAEISRAQVWQWRIHEAKLADGRVVSSNLIDSFIKEELTAIKQMLGETAFAEGKFSEAEALFRSLVLEDSFPEFLTLKAYELLP